MGSHSKFLLGRGRLRSAEPFIFLAIVLLHLSPIFSSGFFVTYDGPAHLYNARLMAELLAGDPIAREWYSFNPTLVPNWTGHLLLAALMIVFDAAVAGKILAALILISFAYAFRFLIRSMKGDLAICYFIFPFLYTFPFMGGFYNFMLGTVLLLVAIGILFKEDQRTATSFRSKMTVLATVVYLCHLLPFAILTVAMILHSIRTVWRLRKAKDRPDRKRIMIRNFLDLLIPLALPLLFTVIYHLSIQIPGEAHLLSLKDHLQWLWELRPLIVFGNEQEIFRADLVAKIVLLLLGAALVILVRSIKKKLPLPENAETGAFLLFMILTAYFILPDSNGSAGFISIRLAMLCFVFALLWLSVMVLPRWLTIPLIAVVLVLQFRTIVLQTRLARDHGAVASECNSFARLIPAGSVVLPLNFSDNWFHAHMIDHIAIEHPVILLNNYETGTGYFPVVWAKKPMPYFLLNDRHHDGRPCLYWESDRDGPRRKIDHVFILGSMELPTDTCVVNAFRSIEAGYELKHATANCRLYALRR